MNIHSPPHPTSKITSSCLTSNHPKTFVANFGTKDATFWYCYISLSMIVSPCHATWDLPLRTSGLRSLLPLLKRDTVYSTIKRLFEESIRWGREMHCELYVPLERELSRRGKAVCDRFRSLASLVDRDDGTTRRRWVVQIRERLYIQARYPSLKDELLVFSCSNNSPISQRCG